jgi:hypothetical protein
MPCVIIAITAVVQHTLSTRLFSKAESSAAAAAALCLLRVVARAASTLLCIWLQGSAGALWLPFVLFRVMHYGTTVVELCGPKRTPCVSTYCDLWFAAMVHSVLHLCGTRQAVGKQASAWVAAI